MAAQDDVQALLDELNQLKAQRAALAEGAKKSEAPARPSISVEGATQAAQGQSFLQNLGAGYGGVMEGLGIGARSIGANNLGIGQAPSEQEIMDWKNQMTGLGNTVGGKAGEFAGGILPAIGLSRVAPGMAATPVGSALLSMPFGALQPLNKEESRLEAITKAGLWGAGGAGAQRTMANTSLASPAVGALAPQGTMPPPMPRTPENAAIATSRAVNDENIAAAREAGYPYLPTRVNPYDWGVKGTLNRLLQSLGGKERTQEAIQLKTQPVTYKLAQQDVGIPPDVPISKDALKQIRDTEGQVYQSVRQVGQLNVTNAFDRKVQDILREWRVAKNEMPKTFSDPAVTGLEDDLVNMIGRNNISSDALVSTINRLRDKASNNLSPTASDANKTAGRLQWQAQNALQDLLYENLLRMGNPQLAEALKAARTRIAKTYSVEHALDENGQIDPAKLKGLDELTGGLKLIQQAYASAPLEVKNATSKGGPGLTIFDHAMMTGLFGLGAVSSGAGPVIGGHGGMVASGGGAGLIGAGLMWPAARVGARSLVTSPWWQKHMVSPSDYGYGKVPPAFPVGPAAGSSALLGDFSL